MNLMADLGPDEREVLAVFERFGQEGRAISTESLAVHAGLKADRKRLSAALQTLAGKGFIKEAGGSPFSNAPLAYRLSLTLIVCDLSRIIPCHWRASSRLRVGCKHFVVVA